MYKFVTKWLYNLVVDKQSARCYCRSCKSRTVARWNPTAPWKPPLKGWGRAFLLKAIQTLFEDTKVPTTYTTYTCPAYICISTWQPQWTLKTLKAMVMQQQKMLQKRDTLACYVARPVTWQLTKQTMSICWCTYLYIVEWEIKTSSACSSVVHEWFWKKIFT